MELNATAASLLGLLHDGPMTGWDLVATAQSRIGSFWTLTQSQVYRELAKMSEAGLVRAGETGPRDRKPFTITTVGKRAFVDWLACEPAAEQIRFPLLLTMSFAGHLPPGRLDEIIQSQRETHAERLTEYRRQEPRLADDPQRLATLRFGIRHEQAVLDWFDELPSLLGSTRHSAP
ncbi:MAG: PadR family transcriptional regulator [Pseudonocardiaceae bacterium]|nr:PadR family transcriptional regulator [Pseudonocardiaceae bacterium]